MSIKEQYNVKSSQQHLRNFFERERLLQEVWSLNPNDWGVSDEAKRIAAGGYPDEAAQKDFLSRRDGQELWRNLKSSGSELGERLKNKFDGEMSPVQRILGVKSPSEQIQDKFNNLKDAVSKPFVSLKDGVSKIGSHEVDNDIGYFQKAKDGISSAYNSTKDGISGAYNSAKEAMPGGGYGLAAAGAGVLGAGYLAKKMYDKYGRKKG